MISVIFPKGYWMLKEDPLMDGYWKAFGIKVEKEIKEAEAEMDRLFGVVLWVKNGPYKHAYMLRWTTIKKGANGSAFSSLCHW